METTLNVLVVDDESNARENLLLLLQTYCPQLKVVGAAQSASDARKILASKKVDVLFLDIAMPNENGFEFLETIEKENYLFVFVTAYDQFVLKALRASAVDYLLKPIDIDELRSAAAKLIANYTHQHKHPGNKNNQEESVRSLAENSSSKKGVQRLCLHDSQGFTILDVNDILYLDADSNYTIFHLTSLKKIVVSKSIKEFEEVLESPTFFRIHKSSIVNLKYLKEFSRIDGYYAIMSDGSSIPVSRRRLTDFMAAIELYNHSTL